MSPKILNSNKIEITAQKMRSFVKDAQRKLLEFEVMMSMQEIKEGKSQTFTDIGKMFRIKSC